MIFTGNVKLILSLRISQIAIQFGDNIRTEWIDFLRPHPGSAAFSPQ